MYYLHFIHVYEIKDDVSSSRFIQRFDLFLIKRVTVLMKSSESKEKLGLQRCGLGTVCAGHVLSFGVWHFQPLSISMANTSPPSPFDSDSSSSPKIISHKVALHIYGVGDNFCTIKA